MIDNLTILISTIMVVYVVWRAAALDRKLPWYPSKEVAAAAEQPKRQFGRPRAPEVPRFRRG